MINKDAFYFRMNDLKAVYSQYESFKKYTTRDVNRDIVDGIVEQLIEFVCDTIDESFEDCGKYDNAVCYFVKDCDFNFEEFNRRIGTNIRDYYELYDFILSGKTIQGGTAYDRKD